MSERNIEHPVWDVYDQRRTVRLREKYFAARLCSLERQNFAMEVVIAVTATTSAIAALTFWNTTTGQLIWQTLLILSALVAIAKPIMKTADKIQRLDELLPQYRLIEHELYKIEVAVRQRGQFDNDLIDRFAKVLDRMDSIVVKPYEHSMSKRLKKRCEAEVASELPPARFYVPSTVPNVKGQTQAGTTATAATTA